MAQLVDSDVVDITAVVLGDPPTPPPGGGGGSPVATVVLNGFAFPGAKLTLVKDGLIASSLFAESDGSFQIVLNNLNYGNYQLSIFAEDPTGTTSSSYTLSVPAFTSQPFVYNNIIIPPTINSSNVVVGMGQQYSVFGYAPPGSTVTAEIIGVKFLGSVLANEQGYWQMNVLGSPPVGVYSIRARAILNNFFSAYSKPVQVMFFLLDPTEPLPPPPPPQFAACVDYNKDRRVNLIDFSILLFWFGKENPPATIDCNSDGVIDIKDFSILMYFWTG
ncbi:MAG TPA: hypothetical protein PKD79_04425 [Candidatus Doudnabacteria bacterium]|nr:hypothetical protein [Candidatus Doudnabacteria bacterium]